MSSTIKNTTFLSLYLTIATYDMLISTLFFVIFVSFVVKLRNNKTTKSKKYTKNFLYIRFLGVFV